MLVPLLQCGAQLALATLLLTATVLTSDGHFLFLYIGLKKVITDAWVGWELKLSFKLLLLSCRNHLATVSTASTS